MKPGPPGSFGAQLKALREAAGYTQEELATISDETISLMRESLTRIAELRDKFAFVNALVPLAAAAALKGDDAWAARILGARHAVTERTGATAVDTSVDDLREQAERDVRARLGPDQWASAYAAGRLTSIDTLLKDIERFVRKG